MEIHQITFNTFQENTFILWDNTRDCIIIDPGCYEKNEEQELVDFINKNNLNPVKLINTHCHIDHILGNKFVSEKWGLELYINKIDLPLLEGAGDIARMYGFENYKGSPYPKHYLEEGGILEFGESKLEILFTPGHAPGHVCLFNTEENFIISGDILFNGSIGRTDLPGGDFDTLIESIKTKLMSLKDETIVYCGHGPSTSIGRERISNPFLQ
ncbi:MAG: MBL fold hydrolase [Flavobacteriales bacterium]|nr:MBL fold hydrolase [Flavobacteriales bacterium]|tara:strand:+ start:1922 stop:2560 length:639 start_codon:yes stop_codon:yes gene_type:complete